MRCWLPVHRVGHQKGAERERGGTAPAPESSHMTGVLASIFQHDSYQHGLSSPWPCRAVLEQAGRVLSYCSLGTTFLSLLKAGFLRKSLELHHGVGSTALDHICMFNPFLPKEIFSSFKHSICTHIQILNATYFLIILPQMTQEFQPVNAVSFQKAWEAGLGKPSAERQGRRNSNTATRLVFSALPNSTNCSHPGSGLWT